MARLRARLRFQPRELWAATKSIAGHALGPLPLRYHPLCLWLFLMRLRSET